MSAMLERINDPGAYQAFQHFITDAPWPAARIWQQLRTMIPDRTGVLILDGTAFRNRGRIRWASRARYCGTLGKVANCQVAVTVALWTGVRAWMLGHRAVLAPRRGSRPGLRQRAKIPPTDSVSREVAFGALRSCARSAPPAFHVTAVLGDAEFGDNAILRRTVAPVEAALCLGHLVASDRVSGTPHRGPRAGRSRPRARCRRRSSRAPLPPQPTPRGAS